MRTSRPCENLADKLRAINHYQEQAFSLADEDAKECRGRRR